VANVSKDIRIVKTGIYSCVKRNNNKNAMYGFTSKDKRRHQALEKDHYQDQPTPEG
jgi:hypothetical protein